MTTNPTRSATPISKALEAFGLIPKDFPLDSFMLKVLTDQVAGLYDPKAKEFYIADWIKPDEQREVMSHELTHALEDQSFHIDPWIKAARPNDDAEMARDAVSEGTAMAAMVDYALRDDKVGVRELPDITLLMRNSAFQQMDEDPNLVKAPTLHPRRPPLSLSFGRLVRAAIPEGAFGLERSELDLPESARLDAADHASGFVSERRRAAENHAA